MFQGLQPLMEHARTAQSHGLPLSWLRTRQQQIQNQQQLLTPLSSQQHQTIPITQPSSSDSFVITVDTDEASDSHYHHHQHQYGPNMANVPNTTTAENFLNNIREAAATSHPEQPHPNNNNNNNVQEGIIFLILSFISDHSGK